jgi:hypothetical protein
MSDIRICFIFYKIFQRSDSGNNFDVTRFDVTYPLLNSRKSKPTACCSCEVASGHTLPDAQLAAAICHRTHSANEVLVCPTTIGLWVEASVDHAPWSFAVVLKQMRLRAHFEQQLPVNVGPMPKPLEALEKAIASSAGNTCVLPAHEQPRSIECFDPRSKRIGCQI